jgi:hypothetical protein
MYLAFVDSSAIRYCNAVLDQRVQYRAAAGYDHCGLVSVNKR